MPQDTKVVVGEVYTHFKGNRYLVSGWGNNSNNRDQHQPMVEYISLDLGERQGWKHFRDEVEFLEVVEWPDGKMRPRFCLKP